MPEKKFNNVLDRYIVERTMDCEDYEEMDWRQKYIIQLLKRAFKRIKAHDK
jgi:hypothetical protein